MHAGGRLSMPGAVCCVQFVVPDAYSALRGRFLALLELRRQVSLWCGARAFLFGHFSGVRCVGSVG
jgi:hypothetical protein